MLSVLLTTLLLSLSLSLLSLPQAAKTDEQQTKVTIDKMAVHIFLNLDIIPLLEFFFYITTFLRKSQCFSLLLKRENMIFRM